MKNRVMKNWAKLAVIAFIAVAFTAAPAMAGHRARGHHGHGYGHQSGHGYGHGYERSYERSYGRSYGPAVHHGQRYSRAYYPPVYSVPVYVPVHRPHHGRLGYGYQPVHYGGSIGIHTRGFGLHIGY